MREFYYIHPVRYDPACHWDSLITNRHNDSISCFSHIPYPLPCGLVILCMIHQQIKLQLYLAYTLWTFKCTVSHIIYAVVNTKHFVNWFASVLKMVLEVNWVSCSSRLRYPLVACAPDPSTSWFARPDDLLCSVDQFLVFVAPLIDMYPTLVELSIYYLHYCIMWAV